MTHSFRLSILLLFPDFIDLSVHPKMKTNFMQTVNLLTTELQLRVEGSKNYQFLKNYFEKNQKNLFFSSKPGLTGLKSFSGF